MRTGGISLHAVDVASGRTAKGLKAEIIHLSDSGRHQVALGYINAQGILDHPITLGQGVVAGAYEALFYLGDWWRAQEQSTEVFFQDICVFRFVVDDVSAHYHLPLKFTKFGLSLFKGEA